MKCEEFKCRNMRLVSVGELELEDEVIAVDCRSKTGKLNIAGLADRGAGTLSSIILPILSYFLVHEFGRKHG
jgi:hypothetical protein